MFVLVDVVLLLRLDPRLVPVLHVVRMVRDLLDHVLQQVVPRKHRVQLAVFILILERKNKEKEMKMTSQKGCCS